MKPLSRAMAVFSPVSESIEATGFGAECDAEAAEALSSPEPQAVNGTARRARAAIDKKVRLVRETELMVCPSQLGRDPGLDPR